MIVINILIGKLTTVKWANPVLVSLNRELDVSKGFIKLLTIAIASYMSGNEKIAPTGY